MPLVDVQVIEGVFDTKQKEHIIKRITDTMVEIEGESLREVTWVRIQEIKQGDWAIGGQPLTADMVHAMQSGKSDAA